MRRTIDAGDHTQVVTRCHAPVIPLYSHERCRLGNELSGRIIGTESIVSLEITHREVVNMYMVTWIDRLCSEADDLVISAHRITGFQRTRGDLVPCRYGYRSPNPLFHDFRSRRQFGSGNDHVVCSV